MCDDGRTTTILLTTLHTQFIHLSEKLEAQARTSNEAKVRRIGNCFAVTFSIWLSINLGMAFDGTQRCDRLRCATGTATVRPSREEAEHGDAMEMITHAMEQAARLRFRVAIGIRAVGTAMFLAGRVATHSDTYENHQLYTT